MEVSSSCKNLRSNSQSKKRKLDHLQHNHSTKKCTHQSDLSGSCDKEEVKIITELSPARRKKKSQGNLPLKHIHPPLKGCRTISIDHDLFDSCLLSPDKKKELPKEGSSALRSPLARMNGPSKKQALDGKEIPVKETHKVFSEFPDIIDIDDIIANISSKKFKPSFSPDEKKILKQKQLETNSSKFNQTPFSSLVNDEKKMKDISPSFLKIPLKSTAQSYLNIDKPKMVINPEDSTEQFFDLCSPIAKEVEPKEDFMQMKNDSFSSNQSSTPLKKTLRRIIRRSRNNIEEDEVMSVVSSSKRGRKFTVLPDEIQSASRIIFHQTYKDLDTVLEIKNIGQICPDFESAKQYPRHPLGNRYNVNFNFHMSRNNQELMALGSLRRLSRRFYPIASNVHGIIFRIIENTKDRIVFHRSMELLYNLIMFHPSCNSMMRNYYWSLMCQRFEDVDQCSRWDLLRTLLEGMNVKHSTDILVDPSESEKKESILNFFICLLNDDLRCWMNSSHNHSALLEAKNDMPLVVRLFWPRDETTVGYTNAMCRELIMLHSDALESQKTNLLSATKSLMKLMMVVTQLSEMQTPLKIRKPGEKMFSLAREIAVLRKPTNVCTLTFLNSFSSSEMRLLLSLSLVNRLDPTRPMLGGTQLDFHSILTTHLELDGSTSLTDVIDHFKQQSNEIRFCVLTAIDTYMKLFCINRTWYTILDRYRYPSRYHDNHSGYYDNPFVDLYSRSFSFSHMVEGLKKSKVLLHRTRSTKSLYSILSTC